MTSLHTLQINIVADSRLSSQEIPTSRGIQQFMAALSWLQSIALLK